VIRASKLQLFSHCDHWLGTDEGPSGDAAQNGIYKHGVIERVLYARHESNFPVEALCTALRSICTFVDSEGLEPLRMIERRFDYMPDGSVSIGGDEPSPDALISGKADLIMVGHDRITVVDWKTGRHPVHPKGNLQLLAYAYMASVACKDMLVPEPLVRLVICQFQEWHEEPEYRVAEYSMHQVRETFLFLEWLARMPPNSRPHAGEHCDRLYCPKRKDCELR